MDGQYYNFSNPRIKNPHLLYGLKLYPVCLDEETFSKEIMLLDNLMDTQQIQAFEVSEAGTVENIGLKNLSHFHTLVIDGEAVVGAKQNSYADMYHQKTLEDWAQFNINNRTKYDACISSGLAIMACNKNRYTPVAAKFKKQVNLGIKKYDNTGYVSKIK